LAVSWACNPEPTNSTASSKMASDFFMVSP
jgi:hypothetical protein